MSRTGYRLRAVCLIAVLSSGACWAQTPATSAAAPNSPVTSAPVIVDGRTLFVVQTSLGPYSAQDRAAATSDRLTRLAKDLTVSSNGIATVKGETSTDVTAGDRILLTVTDADATASGLSRDELTAGYIQSIRFGIDELRRDYSARSLLEGTVFTLIATVALIALLILSAKLRSVAIRKLSQISVPPVRIQRVELFSAQQIGQLLIRVARTARLILVLVAFYIYIPLVLSFFPWTREYAPTLVEYVLSPMRAAGIAFLHYLPSLFIVLMCIAGAYLLIRVSRFLFQEIANGTITWPGFYADWAAPSHKIVRFLILAVTIVVVFPYLPGSDSPAFQGISIFLGVLFSLGSTSAVANIVGGVILTYTRAFRIGDRIKIGDTMGDVTEKTLLVTRIRTIKNEYITVPNSMVLSSHIINYSAPDSVLPLILHSTVTIGYDVAWRDVHVILTTAAQRTSRILKDPAPFVLQTSLDDFYISYQINAYTTEASRMALIYGELHQNIQDCFNEAGVEIMSPHYSSLRDGNLSTIPGAYLPSNYTAPPFRVERTNPVKAAARAETEPTTGQVR